MIEKLFSLLYKCIKKFNKSNVIFKIEQIFKQNRKSIKY